MNWAGITLLAILFVRCLVVANKHGQDRDDVYDIFATLIGAGISIWLYWCAGMFGR